MPQARLLRIQVKPPQHQRTGLDCMHSCLCKSLHWTTRQDYMITASQTQPQAHCLLCIILSAALLHSVFRSVANALNLLKPSNSFAELSRCFADSQERSHNRMQRMRRI